MDLKLPALGEGADSGTVVNLFVKEGDQVAKDQPILELENEKAVATIPSTGAGTVAKIFVKTGEKISVGQRILSLTESGAGDAPNAAKEEAAPKDKGIHTERELEETDEAETEERPQEEAPEGKPG